MKYKKFRDHYRKFLENEKRDNERKKDLEEDIRDWFSMPLYKENKKDKDKPNLEYNILKGRKIK